MPGARSTIKPASAGEYSASDEESQLKIHLQKQLEDDVARIFDESIYSDLEVVCGKLKILTHSCILKTRSHKFYHKLKSILHVNSGRNTYDEIYSFVSDVYTECDVEHQEREIIAYLNENFNIVRSVANASSCNPKEDTDETETFYTPKCPISPRIEKGSQKTINSSPSTELTKEYYALVPINNNLLDKELIEQDALSNAFLSIIKSQVDDKVETKVSQPNKPTSLSLSSHISKTVKHSNTYDIINSDRVTDNIPKFEKSIEKHSIVATSHESKLITTYLCNDHTDPAFKACPPVGDKLIDPTYSPDSLITDEPSSSSDYLSATYTCSPVAGSSGCFTQLNVSDNNTKMENIFTVSDSGLETAGLLESINSHKDVTLTDISLTESTLHDLTADEVTNSNSNSQETVHTPLTDLKEFHRLKLFNLPHSKSLGGMSTEKESNSQITDNRPGIKEEMSGKSSKEEKQRQNEEIVILESSSLSSETGSWESVFPPKLSEKDISEKTAHDGQCSHESNLDTKLESTSSNDLYSEKFNCDVSQKYFKSSSCFIDAASLVEEETEAINLSAGLSEPSKETKMDTLPAPSQPVPCSTIKVDISPNDWSECNENDDSLEQQDHKDPDSIQKDLSPTIFEMTPITEDSLCANAFEDTSRTEQRNINDKDETSLTSSVFTSSTPHNSIMSVKASALRLYGSDNESNVALKQENSSIGLKSQNFVSPPIVSGGASIEDHLLQLGDSHTGSPLVKRKIENIPIVSGAYIQDIENQNNDQGKTSKISSAPAWVVDMSTGSNTDRNLVYQSQISKNSGDCVNDNVKMNPKSTNIADPCNKSRSSVDSDSSERSSHKFYIDLSSLPDPLPPKTQTEPESIAEKKNIFTMYIDLGDKSAVKEMPARLSSLNKRSNSQTETPINVNKNTKVAKTPASDFSVGKNCSTSLLTFEKLESLCNDPNISISEIINIPESNKTAGPPKDSAEARLAVTDLSSHTFSDKVPTIEEEPPMEDLAKDSNDLFVKLSDLDKPVSKLSDLEESIPKINTTITISKEDTWETRMTRSIPDNSWGDLNLAGNSRSSDIISSFHSENALSLNRLFPHLKNEFSRSVPGSLSSRTRSPLRLGNSVSTGEMEEQASDMSEISSVQSSICRSVVENSTTEEMSQTASLVGSCQSRLGQDLLRMFLEEIAPDVIVEVSGKRIKAHKCILSSRCQFFAGILSGGWVESAGNVIALPSFSYNVVHFAMCHIYSGLSAIPDSISILELATLADMLGLEGLKEAIMFTLKAKYCHHFHRPCAVCIAGVLECFPLSSAYGLDDLYRKCLRWITKYFTKVWPTKAFATLPSELLEKCYQQHIVHLTTENIVDTVYGCGITVASLQNSRWAETVARMCRRLVNAAAHFAALRLVATLRAISSMPADAPPPARQALNDCLAAAIEWAPPDEACRAYAYLSDVVKNLKSQQYAKPDLITNANQGAKVAGPNNLFYSHAASWRLQSEGALVRAAPRVVGIQAFQELPPELRKRLRELGCIMYGTQAMPVTTSLTQDKKSRSIHHSQASKTHNTTGSCSLDIDQVRASFVPYASKPTTHVSTVDILKGNNDMKKSGRSKPPKVRTTKAQEERAKFNLTKNQVRVNGKAGVSAKRVYENAKPRYLEPRLCKENEKKVVANNKLVPKVMSSSESSRNSSPIQVRNLRTGRTKTQQIFEKQPQAISQDSLATSSRPRTAEPSTDSLSESQNSNKYATYTKAKHPSKGSVESIKSSKYPSIGQTSLLHGKMKTKIPVHMHQDQKRVNSDNKPTPEAAKRVTPSIATAKVNASPRGKVNERKATGSLMNATKSSSAKMVPKLVKDSVCHKGGMKKNVHTKHFNNHDENQPHNEFPVMERSGTFLKDEPTFGDKTTNMDIGP
ncbi:hypothetical protein O3G_MSEX004475 [Manduca sexta]|uniref:BTB domain-containing protein n=1 Tax=Manduca sexta TaxID=7130 RepID=A0A922CHV3_MANSE|nr:hypothetical protein O3G_MSEX004475 [Manduca sexta]KAG6446495.1 hypothetical protein O3G_MSEX004475 [Manduca sexta]KAG6446496.1 hypothetical protein O3G_MSEX004475 [Manduca sexta]